MADIVEQLAVTGIPRRAFSALPRRSCPMPTSTFDAVITDPPYYDNISYADLSDFFYVWLKRSLHGFVADESSAAS